MSVRLSMGHFESLLVGILQKIESKHSPIMWLEEFNYA